MFKVALKYILYFYQHAAIVCLTPRGVSSLSSAASDSIREEEEYGGQRSDPTHNVLNSIRH